MNISNKTGDGGDGFLTLTDSQSSQNGLSSSSAIKLHEGLIDVLSFLSEEKTLRRQLERVVLNMQKEMAELKQHSTTDSKNITREFIKLRQDIDENIRNLTQETRAMRHQDATFQQETQHQTNDINDLKLKEASCRQDVNGLMANLSDPQSSQTGSSSDSHLQDGLISVMNFLSEEKTLRRQLEQVVLSMQQEMTELKKHNTTDLINAVTSLNKTVKQLNQENQELKHQTAALTEEVNGLKNENYDMKHLTATLQHGNRNLTEETCSMADITSLNETVQQLNQENQVLKQQAATLTQEVNILKKENNDMKQLTATLQHDNMNLTDEIRHFQEGIVHLKQQNAVLQTDTQNITSEVLTLQQDMETLRQHDETIDENIRNLTQETSSLKQQDATIQLKNQQHTKDINYLKIKEATCRHDVNSLMANISGYHSNIGFTVHFRYGTKSYNGTVLFDYIVANHGNGYNKSTGKFTCNKSGMYVFILSIESSTDHAFAWITKNNSQLAKAYASEVSGWNSGTASVVIKLDVGDEVWVKTDGSYYLDAYSHFSGALISAY